MTQTQKQQFWQQHLQAWQTSSLSQTAYCRQHELPLANFGYWRKRLSEATATTPTIIPMVRESVTTDVRLCSPGGWQVLLPTSIHTEILRNLLAALP